MTPFCVNLLEANLFCSKILFDLNFDNISRLLINSYLVIVLAVTPLILGLPRSIDMDLASFTKGLFLLFGIFYKDDPLCVDIVWVSAVVSRLGWVSSVLWLVCNSNKTHPPTQPPWPQPLVSFEAVSEGEAAVMTAAQY